MRIGAVIAEYNPFHNGHACQLRDFRQKSACDYIIAIMSGDFVQRGDPAIAPKRIRARWALENGADMVLELPTYYALSSAQRFALGAVRTLCACKISALGFGCECDDIHVLKETVERYDKCLTSPELLEQLSVGKSFPSAVHAIMNATDNVLMLNPNAILAFEYLRALNLCKDNVDVFITKRENVAHDSRLTHNEFASASYIREVFEDKDCKYVPRGVHLPSKFIRLEHFSDIILYKLNTMSEAEMLNLPDVSEGLHNKIKECASYALNYSDLLEKIKSKRYTLARLKRICMCAMLNITSTHVTHVPEYIHVLAIRNDAKALLSYMATNAKLPIIIGGTDTMSETARAMFDIDVFAADTYNRVAKLPTREDYVLKFVTI